MLFQCEPQLIITKEEYGILGSALKLCRDMDNATALSIDEENNTSIQGCEPCPFKNKCSKMFKDCVYVRASEALEQIINVAIVK